MLEMQDKTPSINIPENIFQTDRKYPELSLLVTFSAQQLEIKLNFKQCHFTFGHVISNSMFQSSKFDLCYHFVSHRTVTDVKAGDGLKAVKWKV
jgi:hypothetical protein